MAQAEKLVAGMEMATEKKIEIIKEISSIISEIDAACPPPVYGREVHTRIKEMSGNPDPYSSEKRMSNDNALSLLPEIKKIINNSDDPLKTALKISISGNIIDYGAPGGGDMIQIKDSLDEALNSSTVSYKHLRAHET